MEFHPAFSLATSYSYSACLLMLSLLSLSLFLFLILFPFCEVEQIELLSTKCDIVIIFFWDNSQGLDGEATEPMIKELEEDREESQDPEVEFAIAGAVREFGGFEILLGMIQVSLH